MIKQGQKVEYLPKWQDAGDEKYTFIAVEDEVDGKVLVVTDLGWRINPTQIVHTYMIKQ